MAIQRVSISQQIREHLLDQIARGRMQPGDRVIEAQVASEMNVSSIPVREAIRELVAMGILQSAPHQGAWVRKVCLLETIQAFDVRSVLEPLAVESAAAQLQGKCDQLRQIAKQIVDCGNSPRFREFPAPQPGVSPCDRRGIEQPGAAASLGLARLRSQNAFHDGLPHHSGPSGHCPRAQADRRRPGSRRRQGSGGAAPLAFQRPGRIPPHAISS